MNHKPMLAVDCGGLNKLHFPCVISPKLDGVRAIKSDECVLARSLKPIPNVRVQELLADLPTGIDGELLAGDPCAKDVYRKTVSMVMSDDKPIDGLVLHIFDIQEDRPWEERHAHLELLFGDWTPWRAGVALVPQVTVYSLEELLAYEAKWVGMGYEGVIARKPGSPYKHARSTAREGYLLKIKRFVDGEAEVIGITEQMHNSNEAKTNELGRTARSHKKAGLVGAGVMGTLVVRDCKTGVEFEIGTGFTAEERFQYFPGQNTQLQRPRPLGGRWVYKTALEGRFAKYKHFPSGAKDKPRHPVFLGWRDRRDT
ncbi:MAG TPA: hypothetical protein VFB43_17765 [Terracidiphilus sp.]|nr:hypothetical protein [Terracidiphilus sp.]